MNWTIEYIEDRQFVRINYSGLFSVQEQIKAIEDLLSRSFWRPGMPIFIDHRKLDFGNTNISVLREPGIFHQKNDTLIGNSPIAVLMKSLSDFGRGRQFELLTQGKVSATIKVFLDEEKAIDWLNESVSS